LLQVKLSSRQAEAINQSFTGTQILIRIKGMKRGAIILCGGQSFRMGTDKAFLPFGETTMLERIVATVKSAIPAEQIVIVAATDQQLPLADQTILRDSTEYEGPLVAIAMGLAAFPNRIESTFITGCDTPLLLVSVIDFLFDRLGSYDCIMPGDSERLYPLCAVYKCSILSRLQAFQGRSLHEFVSTLNARVVPCEELRVVDPELISLRNVNTRVDYFAALALAGLSMP
jgi:molybdopterin-guanine dinucleotide biosynthesis protein A